MREQARLSAIKVPHLEFLPDVSCLLEARNEFHHGFACWDRKQGIWYCKRVNDCLNFLRKLDPASAKLELARRGYDWHWVRNSPAGNDPRQGNKHGNPQAIADMRERAGLRPSFGDTLVSSAEDLKKVNAYDCDPYLDPSPLVQSSSNAEG